jgi:transposase
MIALLPKTHIWIAAGVTDLRRGFDGLSGLVQTKLEQSPFSGHVFVFRGRRGDLIKVLWWDGDGLCLKAQAGHNLGTMRQFRTSPPHPVW